MTDTIKKAFIGLVVILTLPLWAIPFGFVAFFYALEGIGREILEMMDGSSDY